MKTIPPIQSYQAKFHMFTLYQIFSLFSLNASFGDQIQTFYSKSENMASKDLGKNMIDDQQSTRKSKRQHKPNSYYTQGITDVKHQPVKSKKKSRRYDSQFNSFTEENNQKEPNESMDQEGSQVEDWYPCVLPNRPLLKLEIVLQEQQKERQKKKEDNKQKIKASADLLSIFQKAIQDVTDAPNQKTKIKPSLSIENRTPQQTNKAIPFQYKIATKKNRIDENEKINNVSFKENVLTLEHNQEGQLKYDMDWERKEGMINENDQTAISIFKEKIDLIKGNYSDLLQRIYPS